MTNAEIHWGGCAPVVGAACVAVAAFATDWRLGLAAVGLLVVWLWWQL